MQWRRKGLQNLHKIKPFWEVLESINNKCSGGGKGCKTQGDTKLNLFGRCQSQVIINVVAEKRLPNSFQGEHIIKPFWSQVIINVVAEERVATLERDTKLNLFGRCQSQVIIHLVNSLNGFIIFDHAMVSLNQIICIYII